MPEESCRVLAREGGKRASEWHERAKTSLVLQVATATGLEPSRGQRHDQEGGPGTEGCSPPCKPMLLNWLRSRSAGSPDR